MKRALSIMPFFLMAILQTSLAVIKIYPFPKEKEISDQYIVEISQNGETFSPKVLISHAQNKRFNKSQTVSYVGFEQTGKVQVKITKLNGKFSTCKILPSSYGIIPHIEGNTVCYTTDDPKKVSVEFDRDITHALLVFADAPETDIPNKDNPNVFWFGPGIHYLNKPLIPKSNQTIYLAPGSILCGLIMADSVRNVRITGRGILDGRIFSHSQGKSIFFGRKSSQILVEGITMVDSPSYFVTLNGDSSTVRNIKTLGWWLNTDGVVAGKNSLIEDCFLRCNDDAIKLYYSNTTVRRCTIWQMENGSPFQISWNMNSDESGFTVDDCDIIRVDHGWDNPNEAVFDAIHGGCGTMSNYLFSNIRIENTDWRLFSLQIRKNKFAKSDKPGKIQNLIFKNISVKTVPGKPLKRLNIISGFNSESRISNVTFLNLNIDGKFIDNAFDGGFVISPNTTDHISFSLSDTNAPLFRNKDIKDPLEKKHYLYPNPRTIGLNSYGQRDFHILKEKGSYYLVATEMPNPEWGKRGIILYTGKDMTHWRELSCLIDRNSLDKDVWYKDGFMAPEIHKFKGKYYLTFSCNNNLTNPYGSLGIGIAFSDRVEGPYKVITHDAPLALGNNFTLFEALDHKVYAYWDQNGQFFAAEMNDKMNAFKEKSLLAVSQRSLNNYDHFLDSPSLFFDKGTYYLLYSVFSKGYRMAFATASHPLGPWHSEKDNVIFTRTEDQAPTNLKMPYGRENSYAPPCEIIGQAQLFTDTDGQLNLVYHSEDKYAEPYLCIDPAQIKNGKIICNLSLK